MDKSYDFFVQFGDKNHVPGGIHCGETLQAGNSPDPGAVKNCCLESCQLLNFYRRWILQTLAVKRPGQNYLPNNPFKSWMAGSVFSSPSPSFESLERSFCNSSAALLLKALVACS